MRAPIILDENLRFFFNEMCIVLSQIPKQEIDKTVLNPLQEI